MANLFLDANIVIDLVEKRSPLTLEMLAGHKVFISPISLHILLYIYKHLVPYNRLSEFTAKVNIARIDSDVTSASLIGPTKDFEDNIQLHSAANSECSFFLTYDKKLLGMKFFGKTRIVEAL